MSDVSRESVVLIETNLDDENPEIAGWLMDQLLEMGALDVYLSPIYMKKNRPGFKLSVLACESLLEPLSDRILLETSSLGVRIHQLSRKVLPRRQVTVETSAGPVDVKLAKRPDGTVTGAPEFESCRLLAKERGLPLSSIYRAARMAPESWEALWEETER